jgi:hypothetical protein
MWREVGGLLLMMIEQPCVGLFGTCGSSKWRDEFISAYDKLRMSYFNPQVDDWTPELALVEAEHLANDKIILFPVTSETYAAGSLAEVGFSVLNAIRLDDRRDFIVMIASELDDSLKKANPEAYKDSLRARALVKQHLIKLRLDNVYVVDSLREMLQISIDLYDAATIKAKYSMYNPHRKE